MSYKKGARRERELIDELEKRDYVGLRAPSSGSTTDRELPDVLVGKSSRALAFEVKTSSGDVKYIDKEEVYDLQKFAEAFGCRCYIAMRFDHCDWYFFIAGDMHETRKSYRVRKENIDCGKTIEEITW